MRASRALLCILAWVMIGAAPPEAPPKLRVGDRFRTPDGQEHVVTRLLGRGGHRESYELRRLDCAENCLMVLGAYTGMRPELVDPLAMARLVAAPSPHLRVELPVVFSAGIRGQPVYFTLSEHASTAVTQQALSVLQGDPKAFGIIGRQLHAAVDALKAAGAVSADIKTGNLLIDGPVSREALVSGASRVMLSDLEGLAPRRDDVGRLIAQRRLFVAPNYVPPELFEHEAKGTPLKLSEKLSYWQTAVALIIGREGRFPPGEIALRFWKQKTPITPAQFDEFVAAVESFKKEYFGLMDVEILELGREVRAGKAPEAADRLEGLKLLRRMLANGLEIKPSKRRSFAREGRPMPVVDASWKAKSAYLRALHLLPRRGNEIVWLPPGASAGAGACLPEVGRMIGPAEPTLIIRR